MVRLEWWPTWKDKSYKVLLRALFENNETTKNREKVKISLTFAKIFVLIDTNLWIEFGFFTKFPIIVQKLKRDIWLITGETDNQTHLLRNTHFAYLHWRGVSSGWGGGRGILVWTVVMVDSGVKHKSTGSLTIEIMVVMCDRVLLTGWRKIIHLLYVPWDEWQ